MSRVLLIIVLILGSVKFAYSSQDNHSAIKNTMCFSSSYEEAREKFLDAARAAGANLESFENPNKGPEGESLYTDVAIIGPGDTDTILVLGSGTHGVEGFAGSAIQTCLLLEGIASDLKPGLSIVLIHAINPYGFAHLRRFNEDNVDLNRNFVDHSKLYPANHGYEKLQDVISPESISNWSYIKSIFRLFLYRLTKGKAELQRAISGGQYSDPQGLFFGGHGETWSNKTIRMICERYLSKAKHVVVIDFHTGLGPYGNAEIILNENKNSPAYKRAVEWWGDRTKTTANGESVSGHLDTTLKLAFPKMLPDTEVTAVSLEFGTQPSLVVFRALRAENWLFNHGNENNPMAKEIKLNLLRAFFPDKDDWKLQVWQQGKEVAEQVLLQLP